MGSWKKPGRVTDPRDGVSCWAEIVQTFGHAHPCMGDRRPGLLTCKRHAHLEAAAQALRAAAKPTRKRKETA